MVAEPVLLIIADISGYTRYMTANAKTLSHSQTIITELIETLLRAVKLPMEVAKLEGDAVLLFCRKDHPAFSWTEARRIVAQTLLTFFNEFNRTVGELSESTVCTCRACVHIESLRLKVVVHAGEALFHRVLNFQELAGTDVILVHRLLKNSVKANQYLLLTETARRDLDLPAELELIPGSETYDDIGTVNTLTYLPDGNHAETRASRGWVESKNRTTRPFRIRFTRAWRLYRRLWFSPLKIAGGPRQLGHAQSPTATTSLGRAGLGLLTLLLTPFMLPVGACFVACHLLFRGARAE